LRPCRSPFVERNTQITREVLMGASLQTIAHEYGLTCERIRKITQHVCRSANPNLYRTMNRAERGPKVGWLRMQKGYFLPNQA